MQRVRGLAMLNQSSGSEEKARGTPVSWAVVLSLCP